MHLCCHPGLPLLLPQMNVGDPGHCSLSQSESAHADFLWTSGLAPMARNDLCHGDRGHWFKLENSEGKKSDSVWWGLWRLCNCEGWLCSSSRWPRGTKAQLAPAQKTPEWLELGRAVQLSSKNREVPQTCPGQSRATPN